MLVVCVIGLRSVTECGPVLSLLPSLPLTAALFLLHPHSIQVLCDDIGPVDQCTGSQEVGLAARALLKM